MKTQIVIGVALLTLSAAPALAQTHSASTTEAPDGTTTTRTVEKDPGGAAPGAVGGAVAGAVVGGPVGAVIGAIGGAVVGHSVAPPSEVRTYVTKQSGAPIAYKGEIVVGGRLDGDIAWTTVPDYPKYGWAHINGRRVVIDNDSHTVSAVY